jgi:hypothetical protein
MAALTKYFPLALIMLLVILVMLFGNFRQPLIIFLHSTLVFDRDGSLVCGSPDFSLAFSVSQAGWDCWE